MFEVILLQTYLNILIIQFNTELFQLQFYLKFLVSYNYKKAYNTLFHLICIKMALLAQILSNVLFAYGEQKNLNTSKYIFLNTFVFLIFNLIFKTASC